MNIRLIAAVLFFVFAMAVLAWLWVAPVMPQPIPPITEISSGDFSQREAEFEDVGGSIVVDELQIFSLESFVEQGGRVPWGFYWREMSPAEEVYYATWRRPDGPVRVGLQPGHWKTDEVPEELDGLRTSTGARSGRFTEQAIVLDIAERTKELLEAEGVVVDIIPATIPEDYYADAFVSIHADGNDNSAVSGFKISGPRRDFSGGAEALAAALYDSYEEATGLRIDANVTRRMSAYYAFNWRRYDHALHPMTPAVIVETGFVTSPVDRAILVSDPQRAARGLAEGILLFVRN